MPATHRSPVLSASSSDGAATSYRLPAGPLSQAEPENEPALPGSFADEFEGIERDIEQACQRKLASLRFMPKRFRAAARREALDERRQALSVLRQKQAAARDYERRLRLSRRPMTGPHLSPR